MATFLPFNGTIKKTIFRKVREEIILKIYNNLIVPTLLYGSENWTLTASQGRRIEAAEMKLLRPLAGYTLHGHKTNDFIRRELKLTGILDRMNWHLHLQRMPQNRIPLKSYHYRPQGRRTIGRPTVGLPVWILPASTWTSTKDTALSEHGGGAARRV